MKNNIFLVAVFGLISFGLSGSNNAPKWKDFREMKQKDWEKMNEDDYNKLTRGQKAYGFVTGFGHNFFHGRKLQERRLGAVVDKEGNIYKSDRKGENFTKTGERIPNKDADGDDVVLEFAKDNSSDSLVVYSGRNKEGALDDNPNLHFQSKALQYPENWCFNKEHKIILGTLAVAALIYYREPVQKKAGEAIEKTGNILARVANGFGRAFGYFFPSAEEVELAKQKKLEQLAQSKQ